MMKSVFHARRLATAGLAIGLAFLADPNCVRAEWPKLWRSSKPKTAAAQPSAVSPAVHASATSRPFVTPASATIQKPAVPYEEVIELPADSRRIKVVDPCDEIGRASCRERV